MTGKRLPQIAHSAEIEHVIITSPQTNGVTCPLAVSHCAYGQFVKRSGTTCIHQAQTTEVRILLDLVVLAFATYVVGISRLCCAGRAEIGALEKPLLSHPLQIFRHVPDRLFRREKIERAHVRT